MTLGTSRFFDINNMQKPGGYVRQTDWFITLVKVSQYVLLVLFVFTGICSIPFIRRRIMCRWFSTGTFDIFRHRRLAIPQPDIKG